MDTEENARAALGIDPKEWIIGFSDEELELLKSAMRLNADLAQKLADKIERTG